MAIEKELLDHLLAGRDPNEVRSALWLSDAAKAPKKAEPRGVV